MPSNYVEIPGSHRESPKDLAPIAAVHAATAAEPIEISVYLKDRGTDDLLKQGAMSGAEAAAATMAAASRDVSNRRAVDYADDFTAIAEFATETGLAIVKQDPARRLIKLSGPIDKIEAAFRTKLHYYNDGQQGFRARSGSLSAPAFVADRVEAVLGLDTRPIAKPKLTHHIDPHATVGHLPNEIAKLYGFPRTAGMGASQCIAIIELGGGFRDSDNRKAFNAMDLMTPRITAISVSGGQNQPGRDLDADGEVALDIQVAGGAAPGASLAVYFAPNTVQGFVDAITRAVHDQQNRPSVISISWGSAERKWTGQGLAAMTTALKDAALLNVTVLAAAGDDLATDGLSDGRAHTDFPASSPFVIGCGGTVIDTNNGSITGEAVWNRNGKGTGGGISDRFELPGYQSAAGIPKSVNDRKVRRGVPDIAGDADPLSGFSVVVGGIGGTIGGTSAVAPLFAGLFALVNEACDKPAGFALPLLYGSAAAFRPVVQGNNKHGGIGYDAGPGWNACTGLGVPDGNKLLAVFKQAAGGPVSAAV
ncbi:peptidase S53 propeptide [Bradyrhizobium oligotrophicum S58]|uniref:Peptidase S53 propeptide n=1 Tax=Bradyrhizobium oligotrophicum S58 TaxID=1245469 RepID=M4ZHP0_9BRAD|nr:S53 family peptidase [Bradyrhizobium oligotrophicum]BAM93171.1 peptidase S53 propeptide [Bradyrhizobium oligotrophicum S58]